ncbi:hypothetical protein NMG60_11024420 [Bertholletia excelsa]
MRGLQKSKRVSWASDVNLCQVRLFLSDDSPSQVGSGTQDNLQAKTSWLSPPTGMSSDDNLPPGFEGTHPANLLKNRLSQVPLVKWRCPPKFVLDLTWQVVAGEESKEVETQNQREMRVLEAVYPRPSAIPLNPSAIMGIEDYPHNDLNTPTIPITPIEEEDPATDAAIEPIPQSAIPVSSQVPFGPGLPPASLGNASNFSNYTINGNADSAPGVDPEVAAAAFTALSALLTSNGQANLIDQDLLIKILSDPKFMEKLIADRGAASNPQVMPIPRPPGVILSEPPPVQISRVEPGPPSLPTPSGQFYPPPNRAASVPNPRPTQPEVIPAPSPPVGVPKDINYYKSLIQQHGEERQENPPYFATRHNHQSGANLETGNNPKPRDLNLKPKIMKPCIYYKSSRGCRHGANCAYQHDTASQQRTSGVQEMQSSKRMKMDREITGS